MQNVKGLYCPEISLLGNVLGSELTQLSLTNHMAMFCFRWEMVLRFGLTNPMKQVGFGQLSLHYIEENAQEFFRSYENVFPLQKHCLLSVSERTGW